LLNDIFDTRDDLNIDTSKKKKLQASVEKKASVNDFDLDALLEASDQSATLSEARTSQKKKSVRIRRDSTPKLLERGKRSGGVSSNFASNKSIDVDFTDELGRLSKNPLSLSRQKDGQRSSYRNGQRQSPRQNDSYSLGDELLGDDPFVSGKRRVERAESIHEVSRDPDTNQDKSSMRRHSSPEASSTQQIRAAPTVSTSGILKTNSPAFLPRKFKSPTTNNKTNPPTPSRQALWGPHIQHRKTKPGPPPTKATEDERRAHETQSRIRHEKHKLLSNMAIRMNDSHTSAIRALIRGSAAHIPPELFGQTIMQEKSACNEKFYGSVTEMQSSLSSDLGVDGTVLGEEMEDTSVPSFRHIEDPTLLSYWGLTPHAKLYGVSLLFDCHLYFNGLTYISNRFSGCTIPSCSSLLPPHVPDCTSTSHHR
jgi:hypothetical protein